MDIDPMDAATSAGEDANATRDRDRARLGTRVAITVALLATFLGVCKVKDDNLVQAMQQAQADKLDHWNFYQARNLREEFAKATVLQLRLQAQAQPASARAQWDQAVAGYEALAREQATKKEELRRQAL